MDDLSYNTDNDNANQKWEKDVAGQVIEGEVVERISKTDLQPITVAGCLHMRQERKQADEFDDTIEIKCLDCPLGWFLRSTM